MNALNLLKMPKPLQKAAYKLGTAVKKNLPEILLGAGVVTSSAAIVTAINGSPKAAAALEAAHYEIENCYDENGNPVEMNFSQKMAVYRNHAKDIVLPFALPVSLEGISLTCFLTSYGVMKKRHAALTLAYQALDAAFLQYRQRVIEDLGPDKDRYYRTGVMDGKCSVIDEETGEIKEAEGKLLNEHCGSSIYARYFDQNSRDWKKDPNFNIMFLKGCEHEFTMLLISRGYVFLNEVYEHLGLPKCAEGQIVGWVNDPEVGECKVDFGITEGYKLAKRLKERDIYDRAILLDFNVDGPVYEYLNKINAQKLALVTPGPEVVDVCNYPREDD